jgi:hypothetical protein
MPRQNIENIAARFGKTSLLRETYINAEGNGSVVESICIDGIQNIPPSQYHNGADVAIVRFSSEVLSIADGYYLLRIVAPNKIERIGHHNAMSQLINEHGNVIFEQPHVIDVFSVDLPKDRKNTSIIAQLNSFTNNLMQHDFESHREWTINYCCSNGMCGVCVGKDCPQQ